MKILLIAILVLIVIALVLGIVVFTKKSGKKSNGTPTPAETWFKRLVAGNHDEMWFPVGVALVSYVVVLIFSKILLPEKIWDFWSGTTLCWTLLAIIPLFVLGMTRGGLAGKIGAIILVVISLVSLTNTEGFQSAFAEMEVERQARDAEKQMARRKEFLARQPKVVTLELPFGEWVSYRKDKNVEIDVVFGGEGCVAAAVDNSNIKLVCMYPEQKPGMWPFDQKMPRPIMYFEKWGDSYRFMALDEDGEATIKVSLQ